MDASAETNEATTEAMPAPEATSSDAAPAPVEAATEGTVPEATAAPAEPAPEPASPVEDVAPVAVRENQRTRFMMLKLSDREIVKLSRRAMKKRARQAVLEEKRARISKALKEKIDAIETQINELSSSIISGVRQREVLVYDERDVAEKVVRVRRMDTDEVVEVRAMTPVETQMRIGEAKRIRHDEGSGAVDPEQPIEPAPTTSDVRREIERSGLTEEQSLALTPDEAEEMRAVRLAKEHAEREAEEAKSKPRLKAPKRKPRRMNITTDVRGQTYAVVVEHGDGIPYTARTPEIDGVEGVADELERAVDLLREAIAAHLGPEEGADEAPAQEEVEEERSISGEPLAARYEPEGDDDLAF